MTESTRLERRRLLQDKVVVLSGVGPGLGRSLGEEAARLGADLVLASRTQKRLDTMAEVVRSHGRRALVVPTDIDDEAACQALVDAALDGVRPRRLPDQQRLRDPADGPADHARARRPAALAGDQRVRAAASVDAVRRRARRDAREAGGSIIMVNSAVLRQSQPEFGGYKLTKGTLVHLASSLATELGPRGIRVNSVAPSWIYEDVNKAYFDWMAEERGVTHDDIYGEIADKTDLKRLATPRGGRAGDAVPRLRPRVGGHRHHPRRELRRVPWLLMRRHGREDLGSFDDIAAAAVRTTGLDDFGGTEHEEGLRLLCEDLVEHGGLTPEGNYMQRTHGEERAGRPAALRARLQGEPGVRRRADRAADLRLRPPAHRHDGAAPAAQRRPRPPGTRAVADRGAAAAAAARDVGRQPDLRAAERGLLRAPRREPRVHGHPLHGCRHASRSAGGSCASPASRSATSRWPTSRSTPPGWSSRTGPTPTSGTRPTCS